MNVSAGEGPPAAQHYTLVVDGVLAFAFPGFGVDENDMASDDEDMICIRFVLIAITGLSAGGRVLWCVFDVYGVDEYCRRVSSHPLSDHLRGLLLTQDTRLDRTRFEVGGYGWVVNLVGEGCACHPEVSASVLECLVDSLVPE